MQTRIVFLAATLLIFLTITAVTADDGKLSVTVNGHSITATGVAPGSTAVFFGVALVPIPHAYMNHIQRWAVTVDDTAHQGTVTLDLQQNVPPGSVWAVVDLRNAHYGIVSGQGLGLRETPLTNPLRKGQSQTADHFVFDHLFLDLLYVHPQTGAWTWSAVGGTSPEKDGPPNSTIVSLTDGKPVGQAGQRPLSFLPGGTLVAVDFSRLQIAVVPVDEQLIGGAR